MSWAIGYSRVFENVIRSLKRGQARSRTGRMKMDSDTGKRMIAARFSTIEPTFGNLRHNKRLMRRGKVGGQWKLYRMLHNVENPVRRGYAG